MGATNGADVLGWPSPCPWELKLGRTRRHGLSSFHTQSSVPPPKSRGGACLAVPRHKDHARWRSGLRLRWSLDAQGQRTAGKPALAQDNQAPEGSVQSQRASQPPGIMVPWHESSRSKIEKVFIKFA